MALSIEKLKKIYFLGIGGIGMSAIARYLHKMGVSVSGYDKVSTPLTDKLQKEGIKIFFEENIKNIPKDVDLIVYTPAIPDDHAEWVWLQDKKIPLLKRAAVLGLISKVKKVIAVAGTHGKTTTSSLLTYILRKGGVDCSAFLGGIPVDFGTNYVEGQSDYVVVEADEFDRSFLHLHPYISIVTATDPDHLDIYHTHENLLDAFNQFVRQNNPELPVFINENASILKASNQHEIHYGEDGGEIRAINIRVEDGAFYFDYIGLEDKIKDIKMSLPGRHNIQNAVAAISVALSLGVTAKSIKESLAQFKGIGRRFQFIGETPNGVKLFDDYAHHPDELRAAIGTARELFPDKKITGIFQPHLYSRTKDFADGFAEALDLLDEVFLLSIYPARELPIEGVSSQMILDRMTISQVQIKNNFNIFIQKDFEFAEIVLTLGAGNISAFVPELHALLLKN